MAKDSGRRSYDFQRKVQRAVLRHLILVSRKSPARLSLLGANPTMRTPRAIWEAEIRWIHFCKACRESENHDSFRKTYGKRRSFCRLLLRRTLGPVLTNRELSQNLRHLRRRWFKKSANTHGGGKGMLRLPLVTAVLGLPQVSRSSSGAAGHWS
jgi:hypothetical protein